MSCDLVFGVLQDLGSEGLVEITKLAQFEHPLPVTRIDLLELGEACLVFPTLAVLSDFIDLSLYKLISDLTKRRKIRYIFLEHDQNHPPLRRRQLRCLLLPVIKTHPLEVGR